MASGIGKRERYALKALIAGPARRSALPERVKNLCDGEWLEAGFLVKQEVGFGKFLYCVRDSRLSAFMDAIDRVFPGFDDDESELAGPTTATQVKSTSQHARQKDGVVMLRDFSGVLGGKSHLDDLQSFRLSTVERAPIRTGLVVLTVENMDSFLSVEPNKNGIPAFDVAIYLSGNPSDRLLQWVSGIKYSNFTHLGNFDYPGLTTYQRFANWCTKGACRMFRPKGLEKVFEEKKAEAKSPGRKKQVEARPTAGDPEIDEILRLIDANDGIGITQEILEMELDLVE